MRIHEVELFHFRNHTHTKVTWAPYINILIGPNGAGKTSIVDAIHYLCMSRSFVTSSDSHVVKQDTKSFLLRGHFEGQIRAQFQLALSYSRGDGKKIFVNEGPLDKLSDLIGMVPVVVLSPQDEQLTKGGPVERRVFIDAFISQLSRSYLRNLMEYRQVRRQRNKLLQKYAEGGSFRVDKSMMQSYLEPWNEQLVRVGSKIIEERAQVIKQLERFVQYNFTEISGLEMQPGMRYEAMVSGWEGDAEANLDKDLSKRDTKSDDKANTDVHLSNEHAMDDSPISLTRLERIEQCFREALRAQFDKELERGQSLVGPHRDEIVFYLSEVELRRYGSQGQHRLFALALKLGQLDYYTKELEDAPLLILDDVFGDLDGDRVRILLEHLKAHKGQSFITAAHPVAFSDFVDFDHPDHLCITIKNGNVVETN